MIEFVYRPSRRVRGKRVLSRVYSGRYSLRKGEPAVTVALDTPDAKVARKRLRDIVVEKQREAEGIVSPAAIREAASVALTSLVTEYVADMRRRELSPNHIRDTEARLQRMLLETGWVRLGDVRSDGFLRWLGTVEGAAKTRKEYQVTANAFLNWLVRVDRLSRNPLGKLDKVEVRGKQVRKARSFTVDELRSLFAVSGKRRLAYRTIFYTAQRKNEVRQLVWDDLHLGVPNPYALFRDSTTKDKDKRPVPLHPRLAAELLAARPVDFKPDMPVFPSLPHHETLRADLRRAGVVLKDDLGRVVHFHSFRKTWQTLGVKHGLNQRAAQDILGHSDANLTANVYTDVPALALHSEVQKLPWIDAQTDSQGLVRSPVRKGFRELIGELIALAQSVVSEGKAEAEGGAKMVVGPGFEPGKGRAQEIYSLSSLAT